MTCARLSALSRATAQSERARSATFWVDKALSLAEQPERGRVVREQDDPAVREIVSRSYRIIYEVVYQPTAVFVLRFWHGARGTPKIEEA